MSVKKRRQCFLPWRATVPVGIQGNLLRPARMITRMKAMLVAEIQAMFHAAFATRAGELNLESIRILSA